ncbi:MAG: GNAT family N-acetyltransferase [Candidatus Adiutrix sp.]|nr:GNAT family N-acetyltransferase [Candidatus Adiutrix sp.]
MLNNDLQAARIVAGTLTLLAREIHEVGPPVDLWNPELGPGFIRDTAARVGRGEAHPLWVEERHPARGLVIYAPSPWESDFFGFGCARLLGPFLVVEDQRDREERVRKLARLSVAAGRTADHRLITVKTFHDPAVLRGFLAEGFELAEIGASLSGPVPEGCGPVSLPSGFQFLSTDDLPDMLEEIVEGLGDFFYDGHFRHDPTPGPEEARRLWSRVAKADLSGGAEPAVALWDRGKDRPAGLATVHKEGQEARLNILAVAPAYRGRGLGQLIMAEVFRRLQGWGAVLKVETASYNLPALALYRGLGLRQTAPLVALHRHLS